MKKFLHQVEPRRPVVNEVINQTGGMVHYESRSNKRLALQITSKQFDQVDFGTQMKEKVSD